MDETLEGAAERELKEETGIVAAGLKPYRVFDKPDRDPRGRTITQVFVGLFKNRPGDAMAADDAADLSWFDLDELPELAFDHATIIEIAKADLLAGNLF